MKWWILVLGIAANSSASLLVKYAVQPPFRFPSLADPVGALRNWPFWLGLSLYGVAFLLYAAALARLPLNVAYPVLTTGAIAVVTVSSALILKEPVYWTTIAGILFVIAGVVLLTARVS